MNQDLAGVPPMQPESGLYQPRSEFPNPLQQAIHELIRRWRALVAFPGTTAVVAGLISLLIPAQYEGVTIFAPAEENASALPSNIQTIAAQFGVNVGAKGYNVYYFAQVAQSREVLRIVAMDTLEAEAERVPVLELVNASGDSVAERVDDAIRTLRDWITVRADDQADLVTLRARSQSPTLATALVSAVLAALDSVTRASLRLGGSAERRFAQAQADSSRDALHRAENQLRDFYLANRNITSSPSLQFEEARLRRQVQIQQDLYLALTSQAEAAKLQEVRNTPAIAIIQTPQASQEKVWPRASVWALFALLGAFTCAAGWLYVVEPMLPVGVARGFIGARGR